MSAREQETLAAVLAAHFAVDRLRGLGWAALNAAALPTLVLWLAASVRLPAPLVWLAEATWPACALVAIACAASEWHFRRVYIAGLAASRRVARVWPAADTTRPPSATFVPPAAALGSVIWVATVAPDLLAPAPVSFIRTAWATLLAATLAMRFLELSAHLDIKKT